MELEALQASLPEFEARGARLVAISPIRGPFIKQAVEKNDLEFPLLLDPGNRVASEYGLTFTFPDDLRQAYLQLNIDLERFNGDDSWTLPMPARYVIDTDGTILDAEVNPDYTERPEPEETLAILDRL